MSVAVVLSLCLLYTCAVIVWAPRIADFLGVMDHPGTQDHKTHVKPTPLVGGLAAIPPSIGVLIYVYSTNLSSDVRHAAVWALLLAGIGSMLVGFFDDRRPIPALARLFFCSLIFLLTIAIDQEFVVATLDIQGLEFSLQLGSLAVPFTVLCLLAFQNALNMADGKNGLSAGLALIWLVTLLSYKPGIISLPLLTLALAMLLVTAANIGGRLFLGDAGTYGLSAIIGLSTIWVHRQNIGLHTIDVAVMFFFPICDMIRLIIVRILAGRPAFSPDSNHLHHYLDYLIGWTRGCKVYLLAAGLPILLNRLGELDQLSSLGLAMVFYLFFILISVWKRSGEREAVE